MTISFFSSIEDNTRKKRMPFFCPSNNFSAIEALLPYFPVGKFNPDEPGMVHYIFYRLLWRARIKCI